MICPRCGQNNPSDARFCFNCRMMLAQEQPPYESQNQTVNNNNNQSKIIIAIAISLVVITAAVITVLFILKDSDKKKTTESTTEITEEVTTETEPSTEEITTIVLRPQTTTAITTTMPVTTLPPTTTAPVTTVKDWRSAPSNQLYRPPQASFLTTQYQAYAYCTDTAVQNYVKMRLGPSSTQFNTVGSPIANYEIVNVETTSVNGWTLCYYTKTATEGWIRSDFLFTNPNQLPQPTTQPTQPPTQPPEDDTQYYETVITRRPGAEYDYVRPGRYQVVTGDGDPLNLREHQYTSSRVICEIPEGTIVNVEPNTYYANGFVYVKFNQNGQNYEGFAYLQYLKYVGS